MGNINAEKLKAIENAMSQIEKWVLMLYLRVV